MIRNMKLPQKWFSISSSKHKQFSNLRVSFPLMLNVGRISCFSSGSKACGFAHLKGWSWILNSDAYSIHVFFCLALSHWRTMMFWKFWPPKLEDFDDFFFQIGSILEIKQTKWRSQHPDCFWHRISGNFASESRRFHWSKAWKLRSIDQQRWYRYPTVFIMSLEGNTKKRQVTNGGISTHSQH